MDQRNNTALLHGRVGFRNGSINRRINRFNRDLIRVGDMLPVWDFFVRTNSQIFVVLGVSQRHVIHFVCELGKHGDTNLVARCVTDNLFPVNNRLPHCRLSGHQLNLRFNSRAQPLNKTLEIGGFINILRCKLLASFFIIFAKRVNNAAIHVFFQQRANEVDLHSLSNCLSELLPIVVTALQLHRIEIRKLLKTVKSCIQLITEYRPRLGISRGAVKVGLLDILLMNLPRVNAAAVGAGRCVEIVRNRASEFFIVFRRHRKRRQLAGSVAISRQIHFKAAQISFFSRAHRENGIRPYLRDCTHQRIHAGLKYSGRHADHLLGVVHRGRLYHPVHVSNHL